MKRMLKWCVFVGVLLFHAVNVHAETKPFSVIVDVAGKPSLRTLPPLFYGQNIEWHSGGDELWNSSLHRPINEAPGLLRPLHIGLIRFPGGSLSNFYHWEWAIGPMSSRKPNKEYDAQSASVNGVWTLTGGSASPSQYGFDEHMQFVHDVGAQGALITVNATYYPGSPIWGGSAQEAAAWVAYANGSVNGPDVKIGTDYRGVDYRTSRYWARLRAKNGHPAPYHCLYWEIGNEVNLGGQGAGVTGIEYAKRVHEYAAAMHAVDPRIRIGAVLGFRWLKDILTIAGKDIGFLIYHFYAPGSDLQGATFYSNGSKTVSFLSPGGESSLIFKATGTPCSGVWPYLEVRVDDRLVSTITVTADQRKGETHLYSAPINLPAGMHQLTFAYTNDLMTKTEDRNLFVDGVWIQKAGGTPVRIVLLSPTDDMHLMASEPAAFDDRFPEIERAIRAWPPARSTPIRVFVTEFNAMYGMTETSAQELLQMKSALMVDGILQRALMEPRCDETNYWCLNSWYFQILHPSDSGAFLTASGLVYRLFQPLSHGTALQTTINCADFPADTSIPSSSTPKVSAAAVRNGKQLAVNLVNYDPFAPASIVLKLSAFQFTGSPRFTICTGDSVDSSNTPEHPVQVRLEAAPVELRDGSILFTLPAHTAGTLVIGVK